ncbi:FkbM family methyltransferase [Haliscomenobacter sp.]|uniref:FkbM family methyltransferase n=1 Tax=Haliscomenobacter sp. TaxID=2717303 RepID=UPI003BA85B79
MRKLIQQILRKNGFQISKYPDDDSVIRMKMMTHFNIDTLLDIGANIGQYALRMRAMGYQKKIISFEPLKSAFEELKKASFNDHTWLINNYALGSEDTSSTINVANNSFSSSILNMLPAHLSSAPESKYVAKEEIDIKKIDSIFKAFCAKGESVMIKIDTQGYEKNVLDGASESLDDIKIIQLEMSIAPLYENEMTYLEMIKYLDNKGYQLFNLENGFTDSITGQLRQVDGIFVQKHIL